MGYFRPKVYHLVIAPCAVSADYQVVGHHKRQKTAYALHQEAYAKIQ